MNYSYYTYDNERIYSLFICEYDSKEEIFGGAYKSMEDLEDAYISAHKKKTPYQYVVCKKYGFPFNPNFNTDII